MAVCKQCEEPNLLWEQDLEGRWKLKTKEGDKHQCLIFEVPIYIMINGILARYREERIAYNMTNLCIQQGLDAYTTQFERVGDVLRVRRNGDK